jgi:putative transposase
MPASVTLTTMLPRSITKNESAASWRERVREALAKRERAIREERAAAKRRILGRKEVLRARHTDSPTTPAPKRRLRPALACKNPELRLAVIAQLKEFRARHRVARRLWCAGKRRTRFPIGTYRMLAFGVRCTPLAPLPV